jgi:hypothetical protein
MNINKLITLLFVSLIWLQGFTQTKKYAGTYSYGDKRPAGYLDIYPESDSTLLFDIYLIKLNYHIGVNAGRIIIRHDSAIYIDEDSSKGMDCRLLFEFKSKKVIVKTMNEHDNCGYGYGVISDGIYNKKSNKVPAYFIYGEDTIYFKNFKWDK